MYLFLLAFLHMVYIYWEGAAEETIRDTAAKHPQEKTPGQEVTPETGNYKTKQETNPHRDQGGVDGRRDGVGVKLVDVQM